MGVAVGKGGIEVGESGGELELVMGIWVGLLGLSGKVGGGDEGGGVGWGELICRGRGEGEVVEKGVALRR